MILTNLTSGREVQPERTIVHVSCDLLGDLKSTRLWFSFETQAPDLSACISYDPFILPALFICMKEGRDLKIDGEVSRRLCFAICNGMQSILVEQLPGLKPVSIHAEATSRPPAGKRGAITGLSLGVDCLMVLQRFLFDQIDDDYSIKCLVFNDVGSHGAVDPHNVYLRRRITADNAAASLGLPLVHIRSNLNQVLPISFLQTHSIRNFSAALLLQNSFDKFYYASGFHYRDMKVATRSMGHSDAFLFPFLSTEALSAFAVGADLTRVQKTALLSKLSARIRTLDVCVVPHEANRFTNCGTCNKCLRTLVTLEMLGQLDLFADSFDMNRYCQERRRYLIRLLSDKNAYHREILEHAFQVEYRFGLSPLQFATLRAQAAVRRAYSVFRSVLPKGLKRALRKVVSLFVH